MKITIREMQEQELVPARLQHGEMVEAIRGSSPTGRSWEIEIPDEAGTKVRDDLVWQIDNLITRLGMVLQDAASNFRR